MTPVPQRLVTVLPSGSGLAAQTASEPDVLQYTLSLRLKGFGGEVLLLCAKHPKTLSGQDQILWQSVLVVHGDSGC